MVGHLERMCKRKLRDSQDSNICEGQYKEWLRVNGVSGGRKGAMADLNIERKGELDKEMVIRKESRGDMKYSGEGQEIGKWREVKKEREAKAKTEVMKLREIVCGDKGHKGGRGKEKGSQTGVTKGKREEGRASIQKGSTKN